MTENSYNYYPAIMRTTPDPMAEKYYSTSPYAWCNNNPVKFIDPDGKIPILLVPLIKGTVGAITDAAAQVTVSMINGESFGQAMSSVDYTSIGSTARVIHPLKDSKVQPNDATRVQKLFSQYIVYNEKIKGYASMAVKYFLWDIHRLFINRRYY